jgi:hypothetical protein
MTSFGTPNTPGATRLLLLGSGELGKEVAIEAQRFGIEVIAADRYADAPAMQVAHHSPGAEHARPGRAARVDRRGEAAPGGARDRSHPHARPWWNWKRPGCA